MADARKKTPAKQAFKPGWQAVKATGGYTFVEKRGAKGEFKKRFSFFMDQDGEAERLAALLRKLDPTPQAQERQQ